MDIAEFISARLDEDEDWLVPWADGLERKQREIKAKRAILREYEAVTETLAGDDGDRALYATIRYAVTALAAIWSDHPDYRQEWRP